MESGGRGRKLINVELTEEGVEAVAEVVVRKLVERGLLPEIKACQGSDRPWAESSPGSAVPALPETGFLRLSEILKFIPISKSSWWKGIKAGKYPAGIKLSSRTTAWRAEDIRALIKRRQMQER